MRIIMVGACRSEDRTGVLDTAVFKPPTAAPPLHQRPRPGMPIAVTRMGIAFPRVSVRRVLVITLLAVPLVGSLPGRLAAQGCAVAASGGGAFPITHNLTGRPDRSGFLGVDFGCQTGRVRLGVIWGPARCEP